MINIAVKKKQEEKTDTREGKMNQTIYILENTHILEVREAKLQFSRIVTLKYCTGENIPQKVSEDRIFDKIQMHDVSTTAVLHKNIIPMTQLHTDLKF